MERVEKYYGGRGHIAKAVDDVSFSVEPGEFVGIMGPSGSGKTTLLNMIATIDSVSAGHIIIDGQEVTECTEDERSDFRKQHLGFIFQNYNLLDTLTLGENIALALTIRDIPRKKAKQSVLSAARQLGIEGILDKYPYEVSGGQKQRAAVARALITDPQLILADEPTGALDSRSSDALLELFGELNGTGQTILMVTHSVKAASHAGRVLFLRDGQVYHQLYRGGESQEAQFRRISDTLTVLAGGGEPHA